MRFYGFIGFIWSYLGLALIFCSGFSSSFGHALIGKWRVLAMASLHWRLKRMATLRWWCPSAVYIWSRSATTTRLPNPRLLSCWPLLCTMWNLVGKLFLATPKEVTFTYYIRWIPDLVYLEKTDLSPLQQILIALLWKRKNCWKISFSRDVSILLYCCCWWWSWTNENRSLLF